MKSYVCVALTLLAVHAAASWAASEEISRSAYERHATWAKTMLAARAGLAQAQPAVVQSGTWYATDCLPSRDFDEVLFPEQSVDLQARDEQDRPLWAQQPDWQDGRVQNLPTGRRGATYLYRTLDVQQATGWEIRLGSDDGLAVWLNGQQLLAKDVARGPAPDQDRLVLALQSGQNHLLLKIFNRGGGHGFYFQGGPAPGPHVWEQVERDFPEQAAWWKRHARGKHLEWFAAADDTTLERQWLDAAAKELGPHADLFRGELELLDRSSASPSDPRWLQLYESICRFAQRPAAAREMNLAALRRTIEDLVASDPSQYPRGDEFLRRLNELQQQTEVMELALARGDPQAAGRADRLVQQYHQLRQEALLANPLLDFDRLLFVRRKADLLGLPQNWQGNCALPRKGYDNQIAVLAPPRPGGRVRTLFRPEADVFVGDVDLHFEADRMLFSMPASNGRWQIWEIRSDGSGLRQVTQGQEPDVDNYDACYLPDGRIIFCSTGCFAGVPCVGGGNMVANLFLTDADGGNTRQLCFDQDHNWCPTVLNNGRILYTRWEYSDSPHYFTRLLFHMNPDGTGQMEYYASNSMWPNSIFYARPVPGHATKVVGVVSGHHGVPRMGELVLFDPAQGRREADGAVQRIPGFGRSVPPVIRDALVDRSWPKFLHPYPLSDKYFVVSCKPAPDAEWGLYLADVFDNLLLLHEEAGYACFEPIPMRRTETPPRIPDRVDLTTDVATVYLSDVYRGDGLAGVPQGAVKALRIYSPHYAYPGMGGHIHIGIDGPWDVRRILGTVPVQPDGSAVFQVPANTPIAVQPLDEQGAALQVMRSWFTAMPGEVLSCVGCHESQNSGPPSQFRMAAVHRPRKITPWHGPTRGFSFHREVQPVLDRNCVGCHNGQAARDRPLPDFRADGPHGWRNFTPSYVALHPYVRRPGPESDYHLQRPLEFHVSTSELIQMLRKGHHGVQLDAEDWDRLITWIDLNVPDHGTWHEHRGSRSHWEQRRLAMRTAYAGRSEDPEEIVEVSSSLRQASYQQPLEPPARTTRHVDCPNWPFNADEARRRQTENGEAERVVELPDGSRLELVQIPAGSFVMGCPDGEADEYPPHRVRIERPFYMGKFEISNAQFALFHPAHDSAYISMTNKDHSHRGHPINQPAQPVVRVTWDQADHFCRWLTEQTGLRFVLPTEAQWEWACRAGGSQAFSYGDIDTDFSGFANLADQSLAKLALRDSPPWHPTDDRFDDGAMVTQRVGRYQPNAWGLYDMHGNAAEWTRSVYRPYPYQMRDGRDDPSAHGQRVVRGGSWYDRPHRARSSFRLSYHPWQPVYNVGFRVVLEIE
jgi:formylglycine-generating enzyme required for sulfatase activity